MRVVDHAEMRLAPFTRSSEMINVVILFVAQHLHAVATLVFNAVGTYSIIIGSVGLQPRQTYLLHMVGDVGGTESTAQHLSGIAQVRFLSYPGIAVGKVVHGKGNAHRSSCIVLQHGSRCDEFTVMVSRLIL